MKTTNKLYMVIHNPMPGRFEEETPMDQVLSNDSLTKVFTDFATAKQYHNEIAEELGANEDEDVSERIYFVIKNITE